MSEISFVDTTLRDGSQSLWASRMSTSTMLSVIEDIDAAGFESMEFGFGPSVRAVQELDEDPTAWLRLGPPAATRTPLRWIGGTGGSWIGDEGRRGGVGLGFRGARQTPSEQVETQRALVDKGITISRISDPWNNFERLAGLLQINDQSGMLSVVNLAYAISPRHTDEYYEQKAAEAAALNPWRICFKDVGGILTTERARVLFPKVVAASNGVPWEFHGHCCTGMASACVVIAAECGIEHIHTGIPPLAEGDAQPSIFTAVRNLHELGFDTTIDLEPLQRVSAKLYRIAKRLKYPIGAPVDTDYAHYGHQVPGGMISHLVYQLRQVGQEARLPEVLGETARVRQDLGYPIMITPLSQFVASQAAINVITGQRYESVSDEIIGYAQGVYGEEAIEEMDPDVRARILDRKRAEELANDDDEGTVANLDDLRASLGDVSDAEFAAILVYGPNVLPLLRREKEVTAYRFDGSPEAEWLRGLPRQLNGERFIDIQRGDVRLAVKLGPITDR